MRLLAIGDIHGYTTALRALLGKVRPTSADRVVFLGDYVDKGPDTAGTLELVSGLSLEHDWIFLRGNHDQTMIDAYRDPSEVPTWECLAGEAPLASYGSGSSGDLLRKLPEHHVRFLEERCRDYYETDSFLFVHAGIRAHVPPSREDAEYLHWKRVESAVPHDSGRTVVCGHSSQETGRIVDLGHTICIDTGISRGRFLTCLDLGDFTWVKASADGTISTGALAGRETDG